MQKSYLFYASFVFAVMQFTVPSNTLFTFWFYGGMAAPLLTYAWQERKEKASWEWRHVPLLRAVIMLYLYVIFHSVLLTPQAAGATDTIRHACVNALFVAVMVVVHYHISLSRLRVGLRILLLLLIITGVIAIMLFLMFDAGEEGARLVGLGQNDHALLGANICATFTLAGMMLLHPSMPRVRYDAALWWVALAITLVVMVLSQSRGPFLAFAVCVAGGLLWLGYWRLVICGAIVVGSVVADCAMYLAYDEHILPLAALYERVGEALSRKSYRMELWGLAWRLIQARPWTGYGMQAIFPYGYAAVNPHNLFISAWYYTGLGGFMLLVVMVIMAVKEAWKARLSAQGFMAMLVVLHGVLACMTDQGQMMKSPAPLWWIFWWGIAMCCALAIMRHHSRRYPVQQQSDQHTRADTAT